MALDTNDFWDSRKCVLFELGASEVVSQRFFFIYGGFLHPKIGIIELSASEVISQ